MAMVAVIILTALIGGPALVFALVAWLAVSYVTAVLFCLVIVGIYFVWTISGTRAVVQVALGAAVMVGMALCGGPLNPFTAIQQVASQFGQHDKTP